VESVNPIKEENLKLIRHIIRQERSATKSRLAQLSGLSVVTIQSLTGTLLSSGEIEEDSIVQPELGRPAVSYRFNQMAKLALVIYLYEKNTKDTATFLVCDLYGASLERREESFAKISLDSFNAVIESLIDGYPDIKIIAFGMPVEEIGGRIVVSDYESLLNINFASIIQDRFGVDVLIENDINAATYGYCKRNQLMENTSAAGIYMPVKYPPGAGICQNGEIKKGRNGLAGEIKYLPFDIDWETFAYDPEAIEDFFIKAVKVFMCIYNPDRIVLFCGQINKDFAAQLKNTCPSDIEGIMLPDIEIKTDLREDFEEGMISLALNRIL
jgi:ROK family